MSNNYFKRAVSVGTALILMILLSPGRLSASESFSIMAGNLALDGQPDWLRWFNESDSPEGGTWPRYKKQLTR